MSIWSRSVEERIARLEELAGRPIPSWPNRSRHVDRETQRALDRANRYWETVPIDFFDTYGSAAAVSASLSAPDYLVKTATGALSAERVVTDGTSITWDWSVAGQAKATRAALTGDVTAAADANATTIAANAVTDGKLRQSAGLSVIGRSANSTGDVADLTAGSDGDVLRRSGTALGFGAIPESSVTNLVTDLAAKGDAGNATTQTLWGITGTMAGATTYYAVPGAIALNTTEYQFVIPHAATLKNLYVRVGTAPGVGQGVVVTVRKNGIDTAITCTVSGAGTTANDTTHTSSASAGDTVSIKAVTTGTGTPADMTIGLELLAA